MEAEKTTNNIPLGIFLEGVAILAALPRKAYDETDEQFKSRILEALEGV